MIQDNVAQAEQFLKSLANRHRLMILCSLAEHGEMSVTDIMAETGLKQTSASQHLARLKKEGIVDYRRDHRILYYSIVHEAAGDVMAILYDVFCKDKEA